MTQSIFAHSFDNGLVLVAESLESVESAAFTCLVPAGAVFDPADRGGLATMACEMATRGAGDRDSRRFVEALDNLGVQRGESVGDAHIGFSAATLAGNLAAALEIYADVLLRPHLPAEQLESGRQVAIQDLRAIEDEPSQKVMLELRRRHYPVPWGRPSEGDLAALVAISIDEIRSHHAKYFRPNGAILGVAGRFDWPRLRDTVGRLLAGWKPLNVAEPPVGPPGVESAHLAHESNQTQIGVAYASIPYRHPDYYQASGAIGVLSGGMSSRLFTEVREKRGLCYSVYASHHTLRDRGAVFCYAGTTAERAQETLDVTIGELVRLAKGVEAGELQRLKARVKSALIMQQESSSARSSALARDWYHLGRARPLEEVGRIVDGLTCESINAYLAANPPRDFSLVTVGRAELALPKPAGGSP